MTVMFDKAEKCVNDYVNCWTKSSIFISKKGFVSIYESNDGGCEHLQLFRNGFEISSFYYEDIYNLSRV